MRRFMLTSLMSLAAVASAVPAFAQQQPPPRPNEPPRQLRQVPERPFLGSTSWTRAEYETFLDAAAGHNLPAQPLERIDLANVVSTLVELGRCTDAREEARQAGDRLMALRARQMCRADRQPG